VIFLALLLLKVLRSFGFGWISVPVVIGLFVILNLYAPVSLQVVMAYLITWVLLLSGVTMAVNHWTGAGDAAILKKQTHLPRWLWAVLWVAGTLGAVYLGFLLLVL
jgi:hypothetical protein